MATQSHAGWQRTEGKPDGHYTLNNDKNVAVAQVYPSRKEDQGQRYGYTMAQRDFGHQGFHADKANYNLTQESAFERGDYHRDRFQEAEQRARQGQVNEAKLQQQGQDSPAPVAQPTGAEPSIPAQEVELER